MKFSWKWITFSFIVVSTLALAQVTANSPSVVPSQLSDSRLQETRYCGAPVRDKDGTIHRSTTTLKAFQSIHPCPSTGLTKGACPGWQINHTIPLACGGCDAVSNMDWMPTDMKTCSGSHCRDRYERKVYEAPTPFLDTNNCKNEVVK